MDFRLRCVDDLYADFGPRAYGLALRMVGDRAAAEDIVQEAFVAAWRSSHRFDHARGTERSWLLAIVRNRAIDWLRSNSTHATNLPFEPHNVTSTANGTVDLALSQLEGIDLRDAMSALPVEQRNAIDLAYYVGLTHVEIAARTGVALGTVKGRLRLGLRRLSSSLAESHREGQQAEA